VETGAISTASPGWESSSNRHIPDLQSGRNRMDIVLTADAGPMVCIFLATHWFILRSNRCSLSKDL